MKAYIRSLVLFILLFCLPSFADMSLFEKAQKAALKSRNLPAPLCNQLLLTPSPLAKPGLGFAPQQPFPGRKGIVGPSPEDFFSKEKTDFAEVLTEPGDFSRLGVNTAMAFGEFKTIKIVYHRQKNSPKKGSAKVYFLDTHQFPYHYNFAAQVLDYQEGPDAFNKNYEGSGKDREFILASLVLRPNPSKPEMMLEIWNGDSLSKPYMEELYQAVKDKLDFDNLLQFHPISTAQQNEVGSHCGGSPVITTEQLYGDRDYIAYNKGEAVGRVKIIREANPLLDHTHIAVFSHVPNDIGLVGAVITEEKQTFFSHVNVKSMNRDTLNMSLTDAQKLLSKYEGKCIELKAGLNDYSINVIPEDQADERIAQFWEKKRPKFKGEIESISDPKYYGRLVPLYSLYRTLPTPEEHRRMILTVGAKAANLGILNTITRGLEKYGVTSPATMSIQFDFYDLFLEHKQKNLIPKKKITTVEDELLAILNEAKLLDETAAHPIEAVRPALEKARALLQNAKVPPQLIELVKHEILMDKDSPLHYTKNPLLLFRSSTNSEDLAGFNGAGLYSSKAVRLYDLIDGKMVLRPWKTIQKDIEAAIKICYSSVWNERAFQEREWFGIKGQQHLNVKAAIAVHGGFAGSLPLGKVDELANGVAITGNIYNPEKEYEISIEGQHSHHPITNPPSKEELEKEGETPDGYKTERVIVTTLLADPTRNLDPDSWKEWTYERISSSSLRNGASIFESEDELRRLALGLRLAHYAMAQIYGEQSPQVDLEWNIFPVSEGGQSRRIISLNQQRLFRRPVP